MHHFDTAWDSGCHMGWMGFGWVAGAALIAAIAWMLVRSGRGSGGGESPETTLKRRYAKGEVDQETYERMLTELRK